MALQSWSCAIGCGSVAVSRLVSMAPVACCKSTSRFGTLRRSARSLQTKAGSASVDTFLEKPFADKSYEVPVHTVIVHDRQGDVTHTFEVPEVRFHNSFPFQPSLQAHRSGGCSPRAFCAQDQYILHTGEDNGLDLPFACRHGTGVTAAPTGWRVIENAPPGVAGCCTACAVRVKSGTISQPRALGISPELKAKVMPPTFESAGW